MDLLLLPRQYWHRHHHHWGTARLQFQDHQQSQQQHHTLPHAKIHAEPLRVRRVQLLLQLNGRSRTGARHWILKGLCLGMDGNCYIRWAGGSLSATMPKECSGYLNRIYAAVNKAVCLARVCQDVATMPCHWTETFAAMKTDHKEQVHSNTKQHRVVDDKVQRYNNTKAQKHRILERPKHPWSHIYIYVYVCTVCVCVCVYIYIYMCIYVCVYLYNIYIIYMYIYIYIIIDI